MSLQPGINPLDRRMPPVYGPGPGQHYSFPSAEEMKKRMEPGMRTMEFKYGRDEKPFETLPYYGPGPGEMERYRTPTAPGMTDARQRLAERKRTSMGFRENMAQGIPNMGGFDPGDLMAAPKLRQDATMNQANMVSSPYFEANEKAAEKTNPMNAASQEPGRSFLMKYIGK